MNVIEVIDSDEENVPMMGRRAGQGISCADDEQSILTRLGGAEAQKLNNNTTAGNKQPSERTIKIAASTSDAENVTIPTATETVTATIPSATLTTAVKVGRQRSRKTQHQTLRLSPDMQFETISLEDEQLAGSFASTLTPVRLPVSPTETELTSKSMLKQSVTTANKVRSQKDRIKEATAKYAQFDDNMSLINQIADDRIRINFLLGIYSMPEMSFALGTDYKYMQSLFTERLNKGQAGDRKNI